MNRLRVLVVPDKFKGTLTATKAAGLIASGWHRARPSDQIDPLPMSDGGDGFGEVLGGLLQARVHECQTVDAAGRARTARWWWAESEGVAVLESAEVIGLAHLPAGEFHPFALDTRGLGALLKQAEEFGARTLLVGIGGSATNDGGFGVCRALGWRFEDESGREIDRWTDLRRLAWIQRPATSSVACELRVAVDVQNPLLGSRGASRVYGPQKGLRGEDFALAESCLERLADVGGSVLGRDERNRTGAGAAGGLGYGLAMFFDAQLESGFELFSRFARLRELIAESDLVITGEGAIDRSTAMGKGVGEVARACGQQGVPCFGLAGMLDRSAMNDLEEMGFSRVFGMAPDVTDPESAKSSPDRWLPELAALATQSVEGSIGGASRRR